MAENYTKIPRTIDTLNRFLENKREEYFSAHENINSSHGWNFKFGEKYFQVMDSLYGMLYTKIYENLTSDSDLTDDDIIDSVNGFLNWAEKERKELEYLAQLADFGILSSVDGHVYGLLLTAYNKFKQILQISKEEKKLGTSYLPIGERNSKIKSKFKVGIVTVTDEEHEAVLTTLSDIKVIPPKQNNAFTYRSGYIKEGKKKIKVIVVQCLHQGAAAAAVATSQMINNYSPEVMAMIGHAAGRKGRMPKCAVGDIMIAKESVDFEQVTITEQSVNGEEPEIVEKSRKRSLQANSTLVNQIAQFKSSKGVLEDIKTGYTESDLFDTPLKVFSGTIVSGSFMARSEKWFDKIIKENPGSIGWDMEIYGFYYAVENTTFGEKPKSIAIKSISDYGVEDPKYPKQLESHTVRVPYACYTSAEFFRRFALENLNN